MSESSTDQPNSEDQTETPKKRVIKIGSQRPGEVAPEPAQPLIKDVPAGDSLPTAEMDEAVHSEPAAASVGHPASGEPPVTPMPDSATECARPKYPPPRVQRLPDDLQQEIDEVLGGVSIDDLLAGNATGVAKGEEPQIEKRYRGTIVKIHRDDVFFALPGNYEGAASMRQFDEPPEVGQALEVVVTRFNTDEGLYELSVPGASTKVQDWSDISPGMVVEAKITAHNSGGLECEVNGIRGFIPISQIAMYRVENLEEFVGEKFNCVINEANESRGNLVLSRRAVLEREKEQARAETLKNLAVGQTHEGIVRNIRDFGAFVDIGGVDGLVHISKLSWDRVKHPSEVLEEGQRIEVKIEKIDEETGKIGLSYRDAAGEHPWQSAARQFTENSIVTGVVSKIMDFGAFVRLAPGVEGLVHISELAHQRVAKVASVVQEGQEVTVKILSIDPDAQRMSLSMKAVQAAPVAATDEKKAEVVPDEPPRESAVKKKYQGSLRGGTDKKTGGEEFGLNW